MEMSDDLKFHLVSEGPGIVRRVGPDVAKVRVSDQVLFVGAGAISTITKATEQLFEVLPESITFVEGAGIPLDFMTAIYSIIQIGRLEKGQVVYSLICLNTLIILLVYPHPQRLSRYRYCCYSSH
jgi:NADPH:quinone reductase-like Zn-dependent oxidoreductase